MIRVESGSRLHFGLLSFGRRASQEVETGQALDTSSETPPSSQQPVVDRLGTSRFASPDARPKFEPAREYGGVGVMVDQPRLRLELGWCDTDVIECQNDSALQRRVAEIVSRWRQAHATNAQRCDSANNSGASNLAAARKLRVSISEAPPAHCGFGSGTQLALSLAAGLNRLLQLPHLEASTMACQVGRGRRSAVGTYGFASGGLIVDRGKLPGESLSPLSCHVTLPAAWRFVIACETSSQGLSGSHETDAFAQLPSVSESHSRQMFDELYDHLLPSARAGEFASFAKSLWRYGSLAGECFAAVQEGACFSRAARRWVDFARRAGFEGVGQTSWGPAVYVVTPDKMTAQDLVKQMKKSPQSDNTTFWVAAPLQTGAAVHAVSDS